MLVGHSLGGNAALHVACRWPDLFGAVATGSAALWWPGDEIQLSGSRVVEAVLASTGLRLWMQAGTAEDPDLLRSNRDLWERADRAGLDLVHLEQPGGHELSAWRSGLQLGLRHLLRRSLTGSGRAAAHRAGSEVVRRAGCGGAPPSHRERR